MSRFFCRKTEARAPSRKTKKFLWRFFFKDKGAKKRTRKTQGLRYLDRKISFSLLGVGAKTKEIEQDTFCEKCDSFFGGGEKKGRESERSVARINFCPLEKICGHAEKQTKLFLLLSLIWSCESPFFNVGVKLKCHHVTAGK